TGEGVAPEQQVVLAGELPGRDDTRLGELAVVRAGAAAGQDRDLRAGGEVQARLDDAVGPQGDTEAGVRAQQRPRSDGDDLLAAAGEGAHDRGTAADVRAVGDDHALRDAPFDH